jgi:hypothetical protein
LRDSGARKRNPAPIKGSRTAVVPNIPPLRTKKSKILFN